MSDTRAESKPPYPLTFDGGFIGDACSAEEPCGDAFRCLQRFDGDAGAFPDGYCSAPCPKHSCFDHADHPSSRCVRFRNQQTPICMISCRAQSDCREGYVCQSQPKSQRSGSRSVCVPTERAAHQALLALSSTAESTREGSEASSKTPGAAEEPGEFVSLVGSEPDATVETPVTAARIPDYVLPGLVGFGVCAVLALLIWRLSSRPAHGDAGSANETLSGDHARQAARPSRPRSAARPASAAFNFSPSARARDLGSDDGRRGDGGSSGGDGGPGAGGGGPGDGGGGSGDGGLRSARSGQRTSSNESFPGSSVAPSAIRGDLTNTPTQASEHRAPTPLPARDRATLSHRLVPSLRPPAEDKEPSPAGPATSWPNVDESMRSAWRPRTLGDTTLAGFAAPSLLEHRVLDDHALVPPVDEELVLHCIDRLLEEMNAVRARRGYEDIVFIESDVEKVTFRRVRDREISVTVPASSLAKAALAADALRRHGFDTEVDHQQAHILSLLRLTASLLDVRARDEHFRSYAAFAESTTARDDAMRRTLRALSENGPTPVEPGEEVDDIRRGLFALYRFTRQSAQAVRRMVDEQRETSAAAPSPADQPCHCPSCLSLIESGDLACLHCEASLDPRPFHCPACGVRNVLFADHRPQRCLNSDCEAELSGHMPSADYERERLSVIFAMLSHFEDFQKLEPRAGMERFAAVRHGHAVEIVQPAAWGRRVLLESQRSECGVPNDVRLPLAEHQERGLHFLLYPSEPGEARRIHRLEPQRLAEELFSLLVALHRSALSVQGVEVDHFALDGNDGLFLRYGHALRRPGTRVDRRSTTAFTAPELEAGDSPSIAADLYTTAAIWLRIVLDASPDGVERLEELPPKLSMHSTSWTILRQCLDANPSSRPPSADVVLSRLRQETRLSDLI